MKHLLPSPLFIGLLLLTGCSDSSVEEGGFNKTKFLELDLSNSIHETIDLWEQRLGVLVTVMSDEKSIIITISPASNEETYSEVQAWQTEQIVTTVAEVVLEDYSWAEDYEIQSFYIP